MFECSSTKFSTRVTTAMSTAVYTAVTGVDTAVRVSLPTYVLVGACDTGTRGYVPNLVALNVFLNLVHVHTHGSWTTVLNLVLNFLKKNIRNLPAAATRPRAGGVELWTLESKV